MTPAYVCYEKAINHNLSILNTLQNERVKIYLALKGFAFTSALSGVFDVLAGASASGVWEALLAAQFGAKKICTFSPAFSEQDLAICAGISDSLVCNSLAQFRAAARLDFAQINAAILGCIQDEKLDENLAQKLQNRAHNMPLLALRCNPAAAQSPREIYNPCARFSRLGAMAHDFAVALKDKDFAPDGLHMHALCEQDEAALEFVWAAFERNFVAPLYESGRKIKFLNLGGGHHITREGYEVDKLRALLEKISQKYDCEVILEPGEAVGWRTGVLRAKVCDIVENELKIAILDASAEAHMPDTMLMPYTSEVENAKIIAAKDELEKALLAKDEHVYVLAANTCLAGDIMGAYSFCAPLKIGDVVEFSDQIHYSVVKNTTFNGVRLPALIYVREDGSEELCRRFVYQDYSSRN